MITPVFNPAPTAPIKSIGLTEVGFLKCFLYRFCRQHCQCILQVVLDISGVFASSEGVGDDEHTHAIEARGKSESHRRCDYREKARCRH